MIAIENKKAQRKTFMPFTYFQKLISNYEQRIARPIRKTIVFVIPFNSHNFEENKKAQRKTFMPFTYFQKLISNYEQRIARPIRKTIVFVIPFNSHNFETVVP